MYIWFLLLCFVAFGYSTPIGQNIAPDCKRRQYDQDSFVCVCDPSHCDEVEDVGDLANNRVVYYTTSRKADRLKRTSSFFAAPSKPSDPVLKAKINVNQKFQSILGFGGAITDSVIHVKGKLEKANSKLAQTLHEQYYGRKGIQYSLGRVPIGGTDFSLEPYTFLDKEDDWELENFNFKDTKVEYVKKIVNDVRNIQLFASPWSAPVWMKTSGNWYNGTLKEPFNGRYYLLYARYLIRFFEEYQKRGISFWGMTVQNEPETGNMPSHYFQGMYFTPYMQRQFVNMRLGPMFRKNWATKNTKIIIHDSWRKTSLSAAKEVYREDKDAFPGDYVDGVGIHWYTLETPYSVLSNIHNLRPDKFILATEACNSYEHDDNQPYMGGWNAAELYAHDIIQSLKNWVIGWADWNIWLDTFGGPNWVGNFVDAPIIVNATTEKGTTPEFYKQPMFYALGHFSKFVTRGAVRVDLSISSFSGLESDVLEAAAFLTTDKRIVVVMQNRDSEKSFRVEFDDAAHKGNVAKVIIEPKSIRTIIWKYQ